MIKVEINAFLIRCFQIARQKDSLVKSDELFCQWRNFLPTKFYADFFSSVKVNCFGQRNLKIINNFSHFSLNEVFFYLGDALLIIGHGSILDGELFNTKLLQRLLLQSVPFYMFAVVQDTHLVDVSTNNFAFVKLPGRYLLVQSQQWKHQHNVKPVQSWQ